MRFVEATVTYRSMETNEERQETRLINLDAIRLITPSADNKYSMIFMREGGQAYFMAREPYEYWRLVLTSEQPRLP